MVYDEKQKERIYKWRSENRSVYLESERKRRKKIHRALLIILGERCALCNREQNQTPLIIHEIYGKSHSKNLQYIIDHKENFVVLCRPHHASLHRFKNEGKLEELIRLITSMLK